MKFSNYEIKCSENVTEELNFCYNHYLHGLVVKSWHDLAANGLVKAEGKVESVGSRPHHGQGIANDRCNLNLDSIGGRVGNH